MRNLTCGNYSHCLGFHAHQDNAINCEGCDHYVRDGSDLDISTMAGCIALAVAVVCPDLYRTLRHDPDWRYCALMAFLDAVRGSRLETRPH